MSTTRQPRFFEMNRYTSVIQSRLTPTEREKLYDLGYSASQLNDVTNHKRLKQVLKDNENNCCDLITCGLCKPKGCFCVTLDAMGRSCEC